MKSTATGKNTSEKFLRYAWQNRLLVPDGLVTTDGRHLEILFPGESNPDGGPDFIGARVRIGNTLFVGDVEVHSHPLTWYTHHHERDPHYNRVILHVVLVAPEGTPPARTASRRVLPLLAMDPFLLPEASSRWILRNRFSRQRIPLPCACHSARIASATIISWLAACGRNCMERRIGLLEERLRHLLKYGGTGLHEPPIHYAGNPGEIPPPARADPVQMVHNLAVWDQVLYEGIVEAMGFSKNREAFRTLASNIPLALIHMYDRGDIDQIFALLFGASGLLPSTGGLPDAEARRYVRRLRHFWKAIRPTLRRPILDEGEWMFFRLRPWNFPTARLAAVSYLVRSFFHSHGGFRQILSLFEDTEISAHQRLTGVHDALRIHPEGFWRTHRHFRSRKPGQGVALGSGRRNAAILSCILPLVQLRARIVASDSLARRAEEVLKIMPPLRHGIPRALNEDLLRGRIPIRGALIEEGMRELYKNYCLPVRCSVCAIGLAIEERKRETCKREK